MKRGEQIARIRAMELKMIQQECGKDEQIGELHKGGGGE